MTSAAPLRPRFAFTRHAVDRFMARVDPSLDDRAALHALRDASTRAQLCERRTRFGQAIDRVRKDEFGRHVLTLKGRGEALPVSAAFQQRFRGM